MSLYTTYLPPREATSFRDWEGRGKTLASASHVLKLNVNHLPTRGTAMGTKVAVAFANIFMSAVETEIISRSKIN